MKRTRRFLLACLYLSVFHGFAADLTVSIQRLPAGRIQISWPGDAASFSLEEADDLKAPGAWRAVSEAAASAGGIFSVVIQPGTQTRFYRLREALLTRIVETSPASGESGVAVTRETIFRLSAPLALDATITASQLFAEYGGRRLLGRVELSSDRRTVTLFYLENLPAGARVRVWFLGDGLEDASGAGLDADGDGQVGGANVLQFDTGSITALPGTAITGRVFASELGASGTNRPLAGVTISVDGAEESLRTVTDANGFFRLEPAPAGRFFVHVDGRTAVGSQWPGGAYYPFVGKAWETVPGRTNNLAGGSGEIFLPLIQADALRGVSATEETKITFVASVLAANPSLAGVEILVPANSLFSDNGARGGKAGIAPVPPDRLPEPLPPGLNLPLVITIQTDGASNFDRPVPMRFPNAPDPVTGIKFPPGAKTALWGFNHDTGRWELQGPMTISPDGQFAVTDPGVGARQPGWFGVSVGNSGSGPEPCKGDDCDGPNCGSYAARCCADWEEYKKPCKIKQEQALMAVLDLTIDAGLFAVGGPGGCGLGSLLSIGRASRDCLIVGQGNDCAETIQDGTIGNTLGCIPVVGGVLGLGWGAKNVIKGAFDYDNCIKGLLAACGAPVGLASLQQSTDGKGDPRLERAIAALNLQIRVSEACSLSLERTLGSPRWAGADSPEALTIYHEFMGAIQNGLGASSPDGRLITAEERVAVLALARPNGASASEATALMNRLQGFGTGSLNTDPVLRAEVAGGFEILVTALEEARGAGWTDLLDGFRIAMAEFSSMSTPSGNSTVNATSLNLSKSASPRAADAADSSFPEGPLYYWLRDLQTGFERRGRLSAQGRLEGIFLASDSYYSIAYLDPETLRYGGTVFRSTGAGDTTPIPSAPLIAPLLSAPAEPKADTDLDSLTDQAEMIIGTNPLTADTDGDGVKDGQEVRADSNPLDGVGLPFGVIAVSPTPGAATDVAAGNDLAVLACANGLAIVDVSNPRNPVQAAVLPGGAKAVVLRGSLALAAFNDGVRLIDLAAPAAPQTRWVRTDFAASAVAFGTASAFAVKGQNLRRLDLASGADIGSVDLPFSGDSLAVRGDLVYVLAPNKLMVCWDDDIVRVVGVFDAPGEGTDNFFGLGGPRRLSLSGNLLYAQHIYGFNVFDLADPATPLLLPDTRPAATVWRHIVPNGTGLALAAVNSQNAGDIGLYNLQPGGTNDLFVTLFGTPGSPVGVALAGGRGYAADGAGGLAVLNILAPDLAGIPPSISLELDSAVVPSRAEANGIVRLGARAGDDIAVRHVDFFINGQFAARDDSFPFEFFYRTPPISPSNPAFQVRLRAEDTAGNASETPELTVALVPDATAPAVAVLEPRSGSAIVPALVSEVSATFLEAIVTPVSAATLSLAGSGPDGRLDTADDVILPGTVQYDGPSKSIVFKSPTPFPSGQYRATVAAGLADAAGNARPRPLIWEFETGPEPQVVSLFPPRNFVRVGGALDELRVTFDQPLPKVSAEAYRFELTFRGEDGPPSAVTPLVIDLSSDARTFSVRTTGLFPPGGYSLTGGGPNVQPMLWEFTFRNVPNEVIGTGNAGQVSSWKYFPGPGVDDVLIVNLAGHIAPMEIPAIKSLTAYTDIRFSSQVIDVQEPIEAFGAFEILNTVFGEGITHVHGPLRFIGSGAFGGAVETDIGAHVVNAYGGGYIDGTVRFSDSRGVLLNHPGSTMVLSNGPSIGNSGILASNAGRIINLGTLRSVGTGVRLEDVRLRNGGLLEIPKGSLTAFSVENEGVIDVSAGAKLILGPRASGGVSSRLTGAGAVEFFAAAAELRGEVATTGPLTIAGGDVTLWRPLVRPAETVEIKNGGTLRLLAPSQVGTITLNSGTLSFNGDSEIAELSATAGTIQAATVARVTGEAAVRTLNVEGQGMLIFAGVTVVSNGSQVAAVSVREGTLRNTGRWLQAGGGNQGSFIVSGRNSNLGVFENAGEFEQTTPRLFVVQAPFRNAGRAAFSSGGVVFDAQQGFNPAHRGAYFPQAGCELVLNGTPVQYNFDVLDLAAGTLRGTGSIQNALKVMNRAVLAPGNPTGDLTIRATGGFEQTASGELVITLGSTGSSRLVLTSTAATLAGTLRVELAPGFSPAVGQTFTILTASTRTGEFTQAVLPDLGAGKKFELVYSPSTVAVRAVAAP